jgi:hypothetical protein
MELWVDFVSFYDAADVPVLSVETDKGKFNEKMTWERGEERR